jgi:hypothetical protein
MKRISLLLASLFVGSSALAQSYSTPTYYSATVAFGSVTASYTEFIAGGRSYIKVDVLNNTNQDIRCRLDTTAAEFLVPAYSSYDPDLGENRRYANGAVQCKHAGVAPTVGNVEIFGYN